MTKPTVVFNGIDGVTGQYSLAPRTVAELAQVARADLANEKSALRQAFGFPYDLDDPSALDQTGWGVIFPSDIDPAIKVALKPLLDARRAEAGDRYKELVWNKGQSPHDWLAANGVGAGSIVPAKVPYYLLIVGHPKTIPFEFQYLLGIDYAVGRLALETVADHARYAESLVAQATATTKVARREIVYWGPRHDGDDATAISAECLVKPLVAWSNDPTTTAKLGFQATCFTEDKATKANLLGALHAATPPALVFTASHGMTFAIDSARLRDTQGALLCQDWTGFGSMKPEYLLAAADIGDDARVAGAIAFVFACFGGGTPKTDDYAFDGAPPKELSPEPFVSRLSQRLLAHPKGGMQAIVAHVDRAWGYSIEPPEVGPEIAPFRNTLGLLMRGRRVGHAMKDFPARYAVLSAQLLQLVHQGGVPDDELAPRWIERNDAQDYVCLGDPAARLNLDALA